MKGYEHFRKALYIRLINCMFHDYKNGIWSNNRERSNNIFMFKIYF